MKGELGDLTAQIIKLLDNDPGQTVKDLAKKLGVNRTFLAGYLKALENQGYVKSKRIGPAKVYFSNKGVEDVK
jgi:predicted transcriptional regulator